ncbi:MAG TPA: GldG family protein [Solimonas sp.]|nr:GldG family protein [Solimonas sp.]
MTRKQTLIQQLISGVLFLAVIGLIGGLSLRYKREFDWTAGNRNTLTEASEKQLKAMPGPITFTVFAPSGADVRRDVETDLGRYRRAKADIKLDYIDPSANPQKVKEYNVSSIGEIVVEYQGRRESLRATTEPVITSALQRLAYGGEQWVVFLEGHGERSLEDAQNPATYARYAQLLQEKGLKLRTLNLVKESRIPDNSSVLVIAAPKSQPLAGELQVIKEYVDKGGNLLWLVDPEQPAGLDELAQALGVAWQDGVAIFPEYEAIGTGHPGFFAAIGYPQNPVTQGFDQITLFPFARSLAANPVAGWTLAPLLMSTESSWLETGDLAGGHVALDDHDVKGPLTIGLTLTREHKGADGKLMTQRVALVGDSDFLANNYLGEVGNQQLGLNLAQWLASRDAQLNINVPKAPDTSLLLPGWATITVAVGFILLLPLALLGWGVGRWMIRRRR